MCGKGQILTCVLGREGSKVESYFVLLQGTGLGWNMGAVLDFDFLEQAIETVPQPSPLPKDRSLRAGNKWALSGLLLLSWINCKLRIILL